ncbi:hypothetical protein GCM10010182_07350 [Actinomadura cremea]|nr:hypothetical protein GCM10010182_07350 [Actinomadura cremea]
MGGAGGIKAVLGQAPPCLQVGEAMLADGAFGHHELVDLRVRTFMILKEFFLFPGVAVVRPSRRSGTRRQYGTAILTESPILDWERHPSR